MTKIILTVGPRGAGKTSFCKEIRRVNPKINLLSRDAFLVGMFGKEAAWDPYLGAFQVGMPLFWKEVEQSVQKYEVTLVDCWNGRSNERRSIIRRLNKYGPDILEAWYFDVGIEMCLKWFHEREGGNIDFNHARVRNDYSLFYSKVGEEMDDFDVVRIIDPSQGTLFPVSGLLNL